MAELSGEGRAERIRYVAADHSARLSYPEEKARAEAEAGAGWQSTKRRFEEQLLGPAAHGGYL